MTRNLHSRRAVLRATSRFGISLGLLASGIGAVEAAVPPSDYRGPLPARVPEGVNPPLGSELAHAQAILRDVPSGPTAFTVAQYFDRSIDDHDKEGWPDRWNPIIVDFFRATRLNPSGDLTPWCAAFVNWCLLRAGEQGTGSASSGGFKNWHAPTDDPKPGDIVVFESTNPKLAREGKGHVGLFVKRDGDLIFTLGGNQITRARNHKIFIKSLQRNGTGLRLHSFRRLIPE
jgi:uncharacterized protein (TIGR02594 family)